MEVARDSRLLRTDCVVEGRQLLWRWGDLTGSLRHRGRRSTHGPVRPRHRQSVTRSTACRWSAHLINKYTRLTARISIHCLEIGMAGGLLVGYSLLSRRPSTCSEILGEQRGSTGSPTPSVFSIHVFSAETGRSSQPTPSALPVSFSYLLARQFRRDCCCCCRSGFLSTFSYYIPFAFLLLSSELKTGRSAFSIAPSIFHILPLATIILGLLLVVPALDLPLTPIFGI